MTAIMPMDEPRARGTVIGVRSGGIQLQASSNRRSGIGRLSVTAALP